MKHLLVTFALLISPSVLSADETHGFSFGAGIGGADGTGDFLLNYDFAYRYQFTPAWGVEIGYMTFSNMPADLGITKALLTPFNVNFYQLADFNTARLAGHYTYPLSPRTNVVFKLGVQHYDTSYELTDYDSDSGEYILLDEFSESDYRLYSSLGMRWRFFSGFEISTAYVYQDVDHFNSHSLVFSLGYSF